MTLKEDDQVAVALLQAVRVGDLAALEPLLARTPRLAAIARETAQ